MNATDQQKAWSERQMDYFDHLPAAIRAALRENTHNIDCDTLATVGGAQKMLSAIRSGNVTAARVPIGSLTAAAQPDPASG